MEPTLESPDIIVPSVASVKSVHDDLSQSYLDYAANFDVAFKKWKEIWIKEGTDSSSEYT
jgi:hypothetical protein